MDQAGAGCREKASARLKFQPETLPSPHLRARRFTPAGFYPPKLYIQCPGPNCHPAEPVVRSRLTPPERHVMRPLAPPAPSGTPSGRGFSLVAFVRLTLKSGVNVLLSRSHGRTCRSSIDSLLRRQFLKRKLLE